ncbi:ras-GEF domain-containing family member 1B [Rhagoletis pomonella]|uniref:ras-GEF domain-containing family member 1B n=1 Tax=Rhagoletis pomonella TaxID=28610 RepID=UPI00177BFDD3|nr:ras-GEF domain-containing family member 1B [Rhagoletis pomonella]XP_036326516.1 ras-GEF domain-containing family member 1B [Rhagoletis pomonella]
MPNNVIKSSSASASSTSNGRSSSSNNSSSSSSANANQAKSITSHKNETKTPTASSTTSSFVATSNSLPDKSVIVKQSNNNERIAAHRRDGSSIAGIQRQPFRKLQYISPQSKFRDAVASLDTVGDVSLNESRSDLLVYTEDGHLVSASLEALITHMVPTSEYYPEQNFIFAFLLSARLFVRPHELLAQISKTWERQQQKQQQQHQQEQQQGVDVVDEAHFSHLAVAASASPLMQRKTANNAAILPQTVGHNEVNVIVEGHLKQRTAIQLSAQNCIRLLAEWIETFPYDFRDERLMQQVRILARKCVYIDNALGRRVSRILQLLVHRLTVLEQYEATLQTMAATDLTTGNNHQQLPHYNTSAGAATTAVNQSGTHNSLIGCVKSHTLHTSSIAETHKSSTNTNNSNSLSSGAVATVAVAIDGNSAHEIHGIMDICPSCAQLAHQLTAIELERLSHIGPEEFVQAFAKEYQHSIEGKSTAPTGTNTSKSSTNMESAATLNDMKKTRNLESYVEWFNRLSYLTASEIVKYPKKKQRVRIIEYWIETARECFNIGNFNSLMAIIAGLNLAPISRLKKTWSKVQSAKFSVLEHQMDPTSNFNSYRSTLKAAMWRSEGATEERERIIIPFFSLFVKDLYFLNEGCSNRLPNNHINFEKCSQLAKQVMEFNEWKKVTCPFEQLPNVIAYLQTSSVLNENTLSMASFECEPPENTEEKGRYKTVKAETKQQLLNQLQEQQQHQP